MATAVKFARHVLRSEIPLGFTLQRMPTLKFANCETQGGALAGGLHGVVAFAQESGDVQVGLLEVGDHGVAHAIESDSIR